MTLLIKFVFEKLTNVNIEFRGAELFKNKVFQQRH